MNQLEQRITKLEKNLRNYRIIFGTLLVTVAAFSLISSADKTSFVPDRIQAKSFEVVNDNGKVIAKLGEEKSNGSLTTYNTRGQKLVDLFTSDGGAGGINTFDTDGDVLFKVTRTTSGGAYMALFNSEVKEIIEFGVTEGETGYFKVNDKYGDKLAWITYTTDGGGYFALLNNNKETIRLSTPNLGGRIGVSNKRGNRNIYIGTQENQDGNITISDASGSKLGSIPANY